MPRPATTAAVVVAAVAVIAAVVYLLPADQAARPLDKTRWAATKEFTAESRGLKFSFRYPADWKLAPAPTPWATLAMTLVPPDDEPGTRIVFVLVDGDMAATMIANGPMVPRAAAVVGQSKVSIGGVAFTRTEWRGELSGDPTYRHSVELQGDVGGRCIVLQCYTSAPAGKGDDADRRFEKWRPTLEAVLATAHLEAS